MWAHAGHGLGRDEGRTDSRKNRTLHAINPNTVLEGAWQAIAKHALEDLQRDARSPREGLIHCADAEGAAIHKNELAAQHKLSGHAAVKLQVAFEDHGIQLGRGNVQQHLARVGDR